MEVAKKAFNEKNTNIYRGYYPVVPGTHSFKEAFEMGIFNQVMILVEIPNKQKIDRMNK